MKTLNRKLKLKCTSAALALGALTACAAATAARAAEPLPPPPPPPPIFTWTGVYAGGQIGYAWGTGNFAVNGFDPKTDTFIDGTLANNPNGVVGGAHLGYQYQFDQLVLGQLVLGIEGSVDGTSLTNTAFDNFLVAFDKGTLTAQTTADVQGSIRAKIGFAWDRLLVYGTGGVAFGGFSTDFTLVSTNTRVPIFATSNTSSTRTGWTAGGGIEYALVRNWWVYVEYRFTDFGSVRDILLANELPVGGFVNGSRRLEENQVQAGFSFRFELLPPPAPIVAKY
jgi:outer membrane immunogenic protein